MYKKRQFASGKRVFLRLALGISALLLLGIVLVSTVVRDTVSEILYENALQLAYSDARAFANEVDDLYALASQTFTVATSIISALPSDSNADFKLILNTIAAEHDFIENFFIGFSTGELINAIEWDRGADWTVTSRPWYIAAANAEPGNIIMTHPYISSATGDVVIAIATYLPYLNGVGAAIGISVPTSFITNVVDEIYINDGFLILVNNKYDIMLDFQHPGQGMNYPFWRISSYLRALLQSEEDFPQFHHESLGNSYFISVDLVPPGWTLIYIHPTLTIEAQIASNAFRIMAVYIVVLLVLFISVLFVVLYFTRNMEENRVVEEQFRLIFDHLPIATSIRDKNHHHYHSNLTAQKLFDLEDKESYITRFNELSPTHQPDGAESLQKVTQLINQAFDTGYVETEWLHQKPDGTKIPSEIILSRVHFQGAERVLVFVRDMREFYKARQSEFELNKRTKLMFDATPLLIQYWGRNYIPIDCNQTCLDFHNFPTHDQYIEFLMSLPHVLDGRPIIKEWCEYLEGVFETGYDTIDIDYLYNRKTGELAYLEMVGIRVEFNDGPVVVTYANDVTNLKKTLKIMHEAEERLKLMLDGTPVACFLINQDFEAVDCNRETLLLFDFSEKNEALLSFDKVILNLDEFKKKFEHAMDVGGDRFEWDLQKSNGEVLPASISFVKFAMQGKFIIATYIFDLRILNEMIEGRRKLEEAQENSRAKSRFLARMSHEIRTPISVVLGISEVRLRTGNLEPSIEESFAKINNSAGVLLGLVNDILDLSKIEAGKMSLVSEKYEIASLIMDVTNLNVIYMGKKPVEFKMSIEENMPATFKGDSLRLKQIMNNLLSNGFKYTSSGSVHLALKYSEVIDGKTTLKISVQDTGLGMSKEQLNALYDEYARFHINNVPDTSGTGLGMPIVYSLIQMMEGDITIESKEGFGTKVTVTIPQEVLGTEVLSSEDIQRLCSLKVGTKSSGKKFNFIPEPMPYGNILVVDDTEANLYVATGLLQFYGLQVTTCNSGKAAITKIREGNIYDIIFMDYMMPEMSGKEATYILREMGYFHPVIALTAHALIGKAQEFAAYGFDGFISKPINTSHLNSMLIKYVKEKHLKNKNATSQSQFQSQNEVTVTDYIPIDNENITNRITPLEQNQNQNQNQNSIEVGIENTSSKPSPKENNEMEEYLEKMAIELRPDFAQTYHSAITDINIALQENDIPTAHRLTHNLKGVAGLIRELTLVDLAQVVETSLSKSQPPLDEDLAKLEAEFYHILNSIKND